MGSKWFISVKRVKKVAKQMMRTPGAKGLFEKNEGRILSFAREYNVLGAVIILPRALERVPPHTPKIKRRLILET